MAKKTIKKCVKYKNIRFYIKYTGDNKEDIEALLSRKLNYIPYSDRTLSINGNYCNIGNIVVYTPSLQCADVYPECVFKNQFITDID